MLLLGGFLLLEKIGDVCVPEFENVFLVVVFNLELVSDPQESVLVGCLRGPSNVKSVGDGWGGDACLCKVCEERSEDVSRELGVTR